MCTTKLQCKEICLYRCETLKGGERFKYKLNRDSLRKTHKSFGSDYEDFSCDVDGSQNDCFVVQN